MRHRRRIAITTLAAVIGLTGAACGDDAEDEGEVEEIVEETVDEADELDPSETTEDSGSGDDVGDETPSAEG